MLTSSCNRGRLALVDVEGFEPDDVSVTVKDGKVTVSAEREEGCSMADTYNYKKLEKEFNLPPGVSEDDVTYSMQSSNIMAIKMAPKDCPHLD